MKKVYLLAFLGLFSVAAYGQFGGEEEETGAVGETGGESTDFTTADTDQDGVLSIEEAQSALPNLSISDANGDGLLNKSEVEAAVPGLAFSGDDAEKESSLIGQSEYEMIVETMDASEG